MSRVNEYEKLGVFYLGRELDASGAALPEKPVLYDSRDLSTHAVCVGMTGSGKTGLIVALLEEAAIDGIPALCIDPKGDLGNLLLTFPKLAASDFLPWVDPMDAQRHNVSVDQLAALTAQRWKEGLAEWAQTPDRIQRFRDAAEVAIYTPGSESGLPLSMLRSFAAPSPELAADADAMRERVGSVAAGLLSLIGRDADPIKSRDHILLANVLSHEWAAGRSPDLAMLINALQKPPFDKVGAFDLETFYPARERVELAMALNNLLASSSFAAWLNGEPLDIQRLLFTPQGKPRLAIVSIAHLSDPERMFVVTLLLNEVIAWMRRQSGTSSLRAIVCMDEIFGYFPPSANPPSKVPMLTLLKQARAFGVGCVLATQNPVDLDYKGLSNAGTWFIGRLQTERDKMRVLEGLESALASSPGFDRAALDKMMSSLTQRTFLMRNVHENAPVLFRSRWALSYLRGPLTGLEISRLMAQQKSEARRGPAAPAKTITHATDNAFPRPSLPPDVSEYFLPARAGLATSGSPEVLTYRPMVVGFAKLHFVDSKLSLDEWRTRAYLAPLDPDGSLDWSQARVLPHAKSHLVRTPAEGASFAPLPATAMRAKSYADWAEDLRKHLYETARLDMFVCEALDAKSAPGESERDFRARLALLARERRDAAVEDLRRKYAPKFATLEDRERRALERVERERAQATHHKLSTTLSIGSSILGALLGRRRISASTIDRAASAARSAGRISRENADVERASESLEAVRQRRAELQVQFDQDSATLERVLDASTAPLRKVQVSPRKSDLSIGEVALVWAPWRRGADGFPEPVFGEELR
jgi:hypothetical protein